MAFQDLWADRISWERSGCPAELFLQPVGRRQPLDRTVKGFLRHGDIAAVRHATWRHPFDGKIVVGESGKDKESQRYNAITHHGRIGQRFHTASDYAIELLTKGRLRKEKPHHFQQHTYEVVDRFDNGDVLIVLIQHVKREAGKGQCLDSQIT